MVESVIPDLVVEVVVTVSGVIISVGIPIILAKLNKFEKLYTTVFGIDNVETISGLVGAVESHENDLVNIKDQQEDIMKAQTEINSRIKSLEESIESRRGDNGAN